MKRDDWTLGNGIKAGDDAWLMEDGTEVMCRVLKIKGNMIEPYKEGNVLVELYERPRRKKVVLGSKLEPIE